MGRAALIPRGNARQLSPPWIRELKKLNMNSLVQVDSSDEEKQAKKRGKKQKKGSSAKKLKHSAASKSAGFFNDLL